MAQETGTILILDPSAEDVPEELGLSAKLPSLEGKIIGLLENRKYHADAFLQELQNVLRNCATMRRKKNSHRVLANY